MKLDGKRELRVGHERLWELHGNPGHCLCSIRGSIGELTFARIFLRYQAYRTLFAHAG
jgi:hypothetical protein